MYSSWLLNSGTNAFVSIGWWSLKEIRAWHRKKVLIWRNYALHRILNAFPEGKGGRGDDRCLCQQERERKKKRLSCPLFSITQSGSRQEEEKKNQTPCRKKGKKYCSTVVYILPQYWYTLVVLQSTQNFAWTFFRFLQSLLLSLPCHWAKIPL